MDRAATAEALGPQVGEAEWSRVEWCTAVGCCVLMLLLGILTSSIGRTRSATAASAPPPSETAVETAPVLDPVPLAVEMAAPDVPAPPAMAASDVLAPPAPAPPPAAPARSASPRAHRALVPRRVERQPDP
jgi:hypothetical protein